VDAIVNPANSALQLGGGVAGAIQRTGGPAIQLACDRIGHCPVGGAVVTEGGRLPARYVIHAVGPVWGQHSPEASDRLLASACRESLALAAELKLTSIALPSISTGIFGFPLDRAATILIGEAVRHLTAGAPVERVIFCLFGEEAFRVYRDALDRFLAP
jgi:O-acetyl-ADP-ribose deacetylase (regulator of RNase III)